jgi:hypothetical protein
VVEALGMSQMTVLAGLKELQGDSRQGTDEMVRRQRRCGGGRKALASKQPEIVRAIEAIVDPSTRGDPMAPLKWTSKSLDNIREELDKSRYKASATARFYASNWDTRCRG